MKRLLLFCIGLLLAGLGVAMGSTPGLGTSPISSLPYVTTFIIPWSFGAATIIINIVFFLGQIAILKRRFRAFQIIQLPMLVVFGLCIDLGVWLTGFFIPQSYILKLLETVFGCFVLAVGVWLQIRADITLLPGDAFIKVVADEYRLVFGTVKICEEMAYLKDKYKDDWDKICNIVYNLEKESNNLLLSMPDYKNSPFFESVVISYIKENYEV